MGMGSEEGKRDTSQVLGLAIWIKSDPLRRWGTLGRDTGRKGGRGVKFCLDYIHFEFLLVKKLSRRLGIRVCSSGERSKLKGESNLIYG